MDLAQNISSKEMRQLGGQTASGLGITRALLEELHRTGVVYCHWKSNEHVLEGMQGITDLDILVDRRALLAANRALSQVGFKRFVAVTTNGYPAVEDYLAMDAATGKLIHVHLHYQLTAGEEHLKGYRLPWEHLVLSTRRLDEQHGIYTADPNVEMVLLFVRMALKLRTRDRLLFWIGKTNVSSDRLAEFEWLRGRVQPDRVIEITQDLVGKDAARPLQSMLFTQPSFRQLVELRNCIRPTIQRYRTYHPLMARVRRWVRELYWIFGVINKRYLHAAVPLRRIPSGGGLLVALLGCDGSGKSTQMKEIVKWLSWKVDVVPIYFGSGDGQSSLLRWPLKLAVDVIRSNPKLSVNQGARKGNGYSRPGRPYPGLIAMARVVWALALAYEKRIKLRKATKARNRGMIVICDRYPQNQVMGFNDGPLLSHWLTHHSAVLRAIAHWESAPYLWSNIYPPDLVVKLNVTPEVARQRKLDMHLEENRRRVNAVKSLRYPPGTNIVNIDADEPAGQVLLMVKGFIWHEL